MLKSFFVLFLAGIISISTANAEEVKTVMQADGMRDGNLIKDPENTLLLKLKDGDVLIEMYPEAAPKHVARIKELVREGFYNGLKFHRVIDGFMAQTGDPLGNGTGGSGQNLDAEFNDLPHKRGAVSMARASDPNSADSQFFICFENSNFLDGQYTVWGQVVSGMKAVDKIKRGTGENGMVYDPDEIISLEVYADVLAKNEGATEEQK